MTIMHLLSQAAVPTLDQLTGLGTAGVMGAMWLWERRLSRQREQQLDEAHSRIVADAVKLEQLIAVVRQNAETMTRLSAVQEQLVRELRPGPRAAA